MKRLFFNSLFWLVFFLLTDCASNKNNAGEIPQTRDEQINTVTPKNDSVKAVEPKVQQGTSRPGQSSDTSSSKRGAHYKKTEIKHNAPNQTEIDSIKKEKTKKKKEKLIK